jgi:hypothetical protein
LAIVFGATLGGPVQSKLAFSGIARVPEWLAILLIQLRLALAVLPACASGGSSYAPGS